ncbi:MAG: non-canonical purine NTP pyrophosphatase, partial [Planctomycetota bacterium]
MSDLFTRPIVLATANPKKVRELRAIFAEIGLEIESLADLDTVTTEPNEIGDTFEANATIKAVEYANQTGRVCLADDSGLEVDALGGAPGVISSHYCTNGEETGMTREERDAANNDKLLHELGDRPLDERAARFVCVMVLATP